MRKSVKRKIRLSVPDSLFHAVSPVEPKFTFVGLGLEMATKKSAPHHHSMKMQTRIQDNLRVRISRFDDAVTALGTVSLSESCLRDHSLRQWSKPRLALVTKRAPRSDSGAIAIEPSLQIDRGFLRFRSVMRFQIEDEQLGC